MTFCGNDNDIQRKMTLREVKNTECRKINMQSQKKRMGMRAKIVTEYRQTGGDRV